MVSELLPQARSRNSADAGTTLVNMFATLWFRLLRRDGLRSLPRGDGLEELIHVERLQPDARLSAGEEDQILSCQRLGNLQLHQRRAAAPGERLVLLPDPLRMGLLLRDQGLGLLLTLEELGVRREPGGVERSLSRGEGLIHAALGFLKLALHLLGRGSGL